MSRRRERPARDQMPSGHSCLTPTPMPDGVLGAREGTTLRAGDHRSPDLFSGSASEGARRPSSRSSKSMRPSKIVYTVVRGVPVKNYRAEVTLTPNLPHGTSIRWAATWDKTLMGRLVHRKLQAVYRQVVDALVAATDGQPATDKGDQPGTGAWSERA